MNPSREWAPMDSLKAEKSPSVMRSYLESIVAVARFERSQLHEVSGADGPFLWRSRVKRQRSGADPIRETTYQAIRENP